MTGVGNGRVILSRWPILSIVSVQVAPNGVFPRQWTTLPAGSYDIEHPTIGLFDTVAPSAAGDGGQSIVISPGYVNWCGGRNGVLLRITYVNGWPHTSLTSDVSIGATSLPVDDCTGWAVTGEFGVTGAAGIVDDSGQQETVQVSAASVTSGPGNLTVPGHHVRAQGRDDDHHPAAVRDLGDDPVRLSTGPHPRFHEYDGSQHPGHRVQRGEECPGTRRAG